MLGVNGETWARSNRLASLDGLRGIAAAMVFIHHVQLPGLHPQLIGFDAGVMVFFALSGYLLYAPFAAGSVHLGSYAVRRLCRILPAYLVAAVGIGLLLYPGSLDDVAGVLTMSNTPVIVAWTLQLEIVFYAVLPVAVWFLRRTSNRRRALLLAALLSLCATVAILTISAALNGTVASTSLQTIASLGWAFVPGMLVAEFRPTRLPWLALVSGVALIAVSVVFDPPPYLDVAAGAGSGLIVAFLVGRPALSPRLVPVALAVGAVSYSFYLWHEAIIGAVDRPATWLGAVVALTISLAVASVVYLLVERPAIAIGRRLTSRPRPTMMTAPLEPLG